MNPILDSNITDMWKKSVSNVISNVYGDKINRSKLEMFLNNEIEKIKNRPVCKLRNQYEMKEFDVEADNITNTIRENNVSVLGNGMMTYMADEKPALQTKVIIMKKDERKYHKKLMFEALEAGDEPTRIKENELQNKVKSETNSMYGVATMNGSFISNIDCASAITAQGRHLISEVLWSVERLVGANCYFMSLDEYMLYNSKVLEKPKPSDELLRYIDFRPSFKDCKNTFLVESLNIDDFTRDFERSPKSYYMFLMNMGENERMMYYYKNNIYKLIRQNPKIRNIIHRIYMSDVSFQNPYNIPEEIKDDIDRLTELIDCFSFVNIITYKRVEKYTMRKRKAVLISDTDSIMPCLYQFVEFCFDIIREDIGSVVRNNKTDVRFVNVIVTILDRFINRVCENYVDSCNGSVKWRKEINFKNELYYSSMVVFSKQKKNYSGICLLQEGREVPESKQLMSTGRELTTSAKCRVVSDVIDDIIENDILRPDIIDLKKILRRKTELERRIERDTKNGIMIYGDYNKYKNPEQYKNIFATLTPRVSYIWNELYPQQQITEGVGMYVFKTSLRTIRDFDKIEDEEIRMKLKDIIYNVYGERDKVVTDELSKYGLAYFAVSEDAPGIPSWVIPFIDIEDIKLKQLRSLTQLSPSLGFSVGSVKDSTLKVNTNMINF